MTRKSYLESHEYDEQHVILTTRELRLLHWALMQYLEECSKSIEDPVDVRKDRAIGLLLAKWIEHCLTKNTSHYMNQQRSPDAEHRGPSRTT